MKWFKSILCICLVGLFLAIFPSVLMAQAPPCQNILIIYDSSGNVTNATNILQNIAYQNCNSLGLNGSGKINGLCATVSAPPRSPR